MKAKKSDTGRWILFIFGLIFFLVGIGAAYSSFGSMTVKYFSSANWKQVPANISSIELKRNYGESTTYSIKARYFYSYKGNHQSSDVSLNNSSDNIGDYWQTLYRKLKQDQANDRAHAWVNPNNPNEALLDRTFRWAKVAFGGIFLFMFGGFGFGAMWLSLKATKPVEQERQEARVNGISSNEKTGFWFLFIFACPFLLIGLFTFFLALPDIINKGEYGALFTLLFVFAGGGMMAFAYINPFWSQNTPIEITLSCKKRVKSGKNTSTRIVWQKAMQGYIEQSSKGMNVRFLFNCPENLPSSNSDSIFWEVRAESNLKKQSKPIKFERNWNIPVEAIKATASSIHIPERFLQQQNEHKTQLVQAHAEDLIKFDQQGSFLNIENTSKRPISSSFGGIIFGLIFTGSGLFTISQNWWPGYIFVFIGGLIIYISIFMLGRSVDVKIDTAARILYTRRKWFGITLYKREVMLFNPSQFSIKQTSSTTSEKELTQWYKVEVNNKDKKVLIAEGIKGKEVAEALKDRIIEEAFPQRFKAK